jgi:hypothetical protein
VGFIVTGTVGEGVPEMDEEGVSGLRQPDKAISKPAPSRTVKQNMMIPLSVLIINIPFKKVIILPGLYKQLYV